MLCMSHVCAQDTEHRGRLFFRPANKYDSIRHLRVRLDDRWAKLCLTHSEQPASRWRPVTMSEAMPSDPFLQFLDIVRVVGGERLGGQEPSLDALLTTLRGTLGDHHTRKLLSYGLVHYLPRQMHEGGVPPEKISALHRCCCPSSARERACLAAAS